MKKIFIALAVVGLLLSFNPIVKAEDMPLQQELTQSDKDAQIQLLLQMIAILKQILQMMQLQASAIENIGVQSYPTINSTSHIGTSIQGDSVVLPSLLPSYKKEDIFKMSNSWPISVHAYQDGNTSSADFSGSDNLKLIYSNLGIDCSVILGEKVILTKAGALHSDLGENQLRTWITVTNLVVNKDSSSSKYSYQLQCHQDGREDSIFTVPFAEEWDGGYQYAK